MSVKNSKTTCGYLPFNVALDLIAKLERDGEFKICLFIASGIYLGLRGSDILSLKWSDIIDKAELNIQEKKTRKTRRITLNKNYIELIERIHDKMGIENHEQFVFLNRFKTKHVRLQYINVKLKSIFTKYNVVIAGGQASHCLRKGFGRQILLKNPSPEMGLYVLMKLFNHSSPEITSRYLGITDAEIANVYELL